MAKRGSTIDNKYEILKEIGRGGMSTVYLAMDKRLNKQWAVKEIKKVANDANNEIVVQSLLAEANLMKRLDHPALPRIVDIIDDGELIYIIMDYIEGESLDKILLNGGAQTQDVVIEWAKQLCDALRYLHRQNPPIIYRDMKPSNVMLKPEGKLKMIDFGIAREYKEHNVADTVSLGTKGYAAPEQFGGRGQTDPRTDIYCLGVTLYHLVTGHNPAEYPYEIYPIRKWNPSLSPGLEKIILKCTQNNPSDRYQNCDELMYALEHYNEIDDSYIRKQKKKLNKFLITFGFSLTFLVGGIVFDTLATSENDMNYDKKISINTSVDYDTKINNYIEAIELYPSRTEAYVCIIEAYSENQRFTNEESTQFLSLYNEGFGEQNMDNYDPSSDEFAELNYEVGKLYFYIYEADNQQVTLKDRALKALSFFEKVVNNSNANYVDYELAQSYYTVCCFYRDYIGNISNTKEPTKEVYENLLKSLSKSLENLDTYKYEEYADLSYIKLFIYEAVTDMIYDQRKGFAGRGVEQEEVIMLMNDIYSKTEKLPITQDKNLEKQNNIISKKDNYLDEIKATYENGGER